MLKSRLALFYFFIAFILFSKTIIPTNVTHEQHDPKVALRDSALLDAKLLLNKQKALMQSIIKKQVPAFEVMLEKIKEFGHLYGKLTPEEKNSILELIKKERHAEKIKLKNGSPENQLAMAKKGIGILGLSVVEIYLLISLFNTPPLNTLGIFEAICNDMKVILTAGNAFTILGLSLWTVFDAFRVDSRINIANLKSMKATIKNFQS